MKKYLFLIIIFSFSGIVLAQNVSKIINVQISQDQYIIKKANDKISADQNDILFENSIITNAQADMNSYNSTLPEAQTLDSQVQANAITAQPQVLNGA